LILYHLSTCSDSCKQLDDVLTLDQNCLNLKIDNQICNQNLIKGSKL